MRGALSGILTEIRAQSPEALAAEVARYARALPEEMVLCGDFLGGVAANTPGLRGIAATAPYLHDGSLKSLRSVLEWARNGEMGDTSMLSDDELDALEAYLRSL